MAYAKITYPGDNASYSLPADWNNADNKIECIGPGGNGSTRVSSSQGGNGGGGGAYAASTNVNLGTGPIVTRALTGGSGGACYVQNTAGTKVVQADFGANAAASNNGAGRGGLVAGCIGDVKTAGGNGGNSVVGDAGGGGGGAAGPTGVGGNGAVGATINGGSADGGVVGQQTTQGATGNSGTEWDSTHGCGGGGAGGVGGGSRAGGAGGASGGGGGGTDSGTSSSFGPGSAALIILQWNPAGPSTKQKGSFFSMF